MGSVQINLETRSWVQIIWGGRVMRNTRGEEAGNGVVMKSHESLWGRDISSTEDPLQAVWNYLRVIPPELKKAGTYSYNSYLALSPGCPHSH